MSITSVRPCSCFHPYQDRRYGGGMRVHNAGDKKWRCTVCGNVKADSKLVLPDSKEAKGDKADGK